MPIRVECPGCKKKLTAKEKLAGKKVKCPACGIVVTIPGAPAPTAAEPQFNTFEELIQAIDDGNASDIATFFHQRDVILAENPEESGDGGRAAMIAEVDGFAAVVAFTSTDHARTFAEEVPEVLDEEGGLRTFEVSGADFLLGLDDEFGVMLNPESEDNIVLPPDLVQKVKLIKAVVQIPVERGKSDPRAEAVRENSLAFLKARGFSPAEWLPLRDVDQKLRPANDIASRLMSLATFFTWVSAPESAVSTELMRETIKKNRIKNWFTEDELKIFALRRADAREQHQNSIGWRLENMWPLAWVLGFQAEPTIEASQIAEETIDAILFDLLQGLNANVEDLVRGAKLRGVEEVIALEDRFYCAHNAVRSAQLGNDTVPEGFDPLAHGGAVHERRHALTWCLSPETAWDDTDLST